jgi:transcriptional regulator GlxA family with amidase domain
MQFAIGLYPGFTALDAIGPYQVFVEVPGDEVILCAARPGRVSDERGLLHLDAERSFADVAAPDVLIVPGGSGRDVRAAAKDGAIVEWITTVHPATTFTASVCTGALLLGAAGLLKGRTATTHWAFYDELRDLGAEPTEQRVVDAGDRIVTAAGVSSGIDLALTLVARLHGDEVARAVQLGIEYDPQPPFDSGAPSKADPALRELVLAVMAETGRR